MPILFEEVWTELADRALITSVMPTFSAVHFLPDWRLWMSTTWVLNPLSYVCDELHDGDLPHVWRAIGWVDFQATAVISRFVKISIRSAGTDPKRVCGYF